MMIMMYLCFMINFTGDGKHIGIDINMTAPSRKNHSTEEKR